MWRRSSASMAAARCPWPNSPRTSAAPPCHTDAVAASAPSTPRVRVPAASDFLAVRQLADQAFSRASGAPLRDGNRVSLLKDAAENYPAWLEAIAAARHADSPRDYFIVEDDAGPELRRGADRARRGGVRVVMVYDWLGCFRRASRAVLESRCATPALKCAATTALVSTSRSAGSAAIIARRSSSTGPSAS